MNQNDKLTEQQNKAILENYQSGKIGLKDFKVLYKDLISIESLKKGLQRTKSNVSPGLDGEVKGQITDKRLEKLHNELARQSYLPTQVKRVGIPKPDGGTRYLGIASQIDKVVQGAILNHLEPLLEPVFSEASYGSRPGTGCHDALKEIKYKWKGIAWIINVDISKYFDKINHEILRNKLEKFCDQASVELIHKLLRVGYVTIMSPNHSVENSEIGTPQGSLISPILANLYLHELDSFMKEAILPKYNRGVHRAANPEYAKRKTLTTAEKSVLAELPSVKGALLRAKHNKYVEDTMFAATDGSDPAFRRLHYVRYMDDFILGFIGPREEAEEIKQQIINKLVEMKLEVNHSKSKIYHSGDLGIKYLGAYIRYFRHNKLIVQDESHQTDDVTKQVNQLRAQAVNTPHFRVPVDLILQRLVDRGLAKRRKDNTVRGTAVLQMGMLEDVDIVNRFSAVIRGYENYYSFVNHRSDLWKIFSVLRKSCALTLGAKRKLNSAARVYAIYGPDLKVRDNLGTRVTSLNYPKSLKTHIDFKTGKRGVEFAQILKYERMAIQGSSNINIKSALKCEYEGCEATLHLEAHHLNPMRNLSKRKDLSSFEKSLIQRERKVVMLCKKHHNELSRKRVTVSKPGKVKLSKSDKVKEKDQTS